MPLLNRLTFISKEITKIDMTQFLPNNAKWKTWIKWLFCFKKKKIFNFFQNIVHL